MYSSKCRGGAGSAGVRDERTTKDVRGGQASARSRPFPPTPRTRLHRRDFVVSRPLGHLRASLPALAADHSHAPVAEAGAQVRRYAAQKLRNEMHHAAPSAGVPVRLTEINPAGPMGKRPLSSSYIESFSSDMQQSIARSNPLAAYKALNVRSKVRDRTKSGHPPPPAPKLRCRETCAAATRPTVSCEMPDAIRSGDVMLIAESAIEVKAPMIRLIVHLPAEPAG